MRVSEILENIKRKGSSIYRAHLLLMCVMLVVALSPLAISNRITTKTLTEYYGKELEMTVRYRCDELSNVLFSSYAIPNALQGNQYYDELASLSDGETMKQHAWMLPRLSTALANQVYLAGDSVERLLYLPGPDSICTNSRSFLRASDCFEQYLVFHDFDEEQLLSLLKEREGFTLLPMQRVTVDSRKMDCLAVVIHPAGANLSVMSIYDRDTILGYLGVQTLPENCSFSITDENGTVYLEQGMENGIPKDNYPISVEIPRFGLKMRLWVPQAYFRTLLLPAYRTSTFLSLGAAVIGFLLCILFADISTRRIRNLARSYNLDRKGAEKGGRGDEVDYLAHLISESRDETETLQRKMIAGALVRAFSGMLLLRDDAELLRPCFEEIDGPYRVALLTVPLEINFALKTTILPENLTEPFYCESVSDKSAGILMPAREESLAELSALVNLINSAITRDGERVLCGVSEPMESEDQIHIAIHQAQIALRDEKPMSVYSEKRMQRSDEFLLWVQHQRLYQCILNGERDEAMQVVRALMQSPGTGEELFYNILFTFRSVAEEMEMDVEELDEVRWEGGAQSWKNLAKLEELLHLIMSRANKRMEDTQKDLRGQLLQYIRRNASDPDLCLTQLANQFDLSEKKAYTLVREETGMKFREYLLSIRMRKAANLVSGTQKNIDEIARACGYLAESTFFRVFKNYYGCTPSQYRANGPKHGDGGEEG